jgi:TPP-dependent 2-oxoacid decarboxylase
MGLIAHTCLEATVRYGAQFHNQTLWASIGWATPAAFGAAVGVTDTYETPPLYRKLHENIKSFYNVQ